VLCSDRRIVLRCAHVTARSQPSRNPTSCSFAWTISSHC
jgi:hypothetical protein